MISRATVIYEDQLSGSKPSNYGPHVLALACVADLTSEPRGAWALRDLAEAVPKKGDAKVLEALKHLPLLASSGTVIAVLDDDQIRRLLKLPGACCKTSVLEELATFDGPANFVLLEANMETVVKACCRILGRPPPTSKPSPEERDSVLQQMAAATALQRAELLKSVPSFDRLVRLLEAEQQTRAVLAAEAMRNERSAF